LKSRLRIIDRRIDQVDFELPTFDLRPLYFRLGLTQARDTVADLPLTAFFEQLQTLEPLQNIPFATQGGRRAQTTML